MRFALRKPHYRGYIEAWHYSPVEDWLSVRDKVLVPRSLVEDIPGLAVDIDASNIPVHRQRVAKELLAQLSNCKA